MTSGLPRPVADAEMEAYAAAHSTPPSGALDRIAMATRAWSPSPGMMVDEVEARLLALLVSLIGARRILEVGTFTGYSAASMAEALPRDGELVTLEARADHAAKAREHVDSVGVGDRVTIVEGPASTSLARLEGPFDLAFIDADKASYPLYFEAVLGLMRPGGLIVADNVLRSGRVLDGSARDADTMGMRTFNDLVVSDARVESVMLTIRDGVSLIRVRD
jgi:caffeoyl-CoA O-methyltransferase